MAIIVGAPTGTVATWYITVTFTCPIPVTSPRVTQTIDRDIRLTQATPRVAPDTQPTRATRRTGLDIPATLEIHLDIAATAPAILRFMRLTRVTGLTGRENRAAPIWPQPS